MDASRGEITGEGDVILTWKSIIKPFAVLDFVLTCSKDTCFDDNNTAENKRIVREVTDNEVKNW